MANEEIWDTAKKQLAAEFRRLRNEAKLSQAQVGELLGITHQQIGKYERGESDIPAHRMDLARNGFKIVESPQSGFAEESTEFDTSPSDSAQVLKEQWRQLKGQLGQFVKGVDEFIGK